MIPLRTLPRAGQQSGGIRELSSKLLQQQRPGVPPGPVSYEGRGKGREVRSDAGVHCMRVAL